MKLKNVVACLAVSAFVSSSTCAMAKNVDNQQKVEKQQKQTKKKNNRNNKSKLQTSGDEVCGEGLEDIFSRELGW